MNLKPTLMILLLAGTALLTMPMVSAAPDTPSPPPLLNCGSPQNEVDRAYCAVYVVAGGEVDALGNLTGPFQKPVNEAVACIERRGPCNLPGL